MQPFGTNDGLEMNCGGELDNLGIGCKPADKSSRSDEFNAGQTRQREAWRERPISARRVI